MPALPDAPGVLRLDWHFGRGLDTHVKCRQFFHYSGTAPTQAQVNTFTTTVGGYGHSLWPNLMSTDDTYNGLTVTDLSTPSSPVGVHTESTSGILTGAHLPADICLLQSLKIGRRFRGGHPRIYWPLGTEAELQDEQHWTSSFASGSAGAIDGLSSSIEAAGWAGAGTITQVSVSYYHGSTVFIGPTGRARNISTVRTTPVIDTVLSTVGQEGLASQRRRLLRLA